MTQATRLLVADGERLFCDCLASALSHTTGLEVVAAATTGAEALALLEQTDPDVAVVDYRLPGMGGPELVLAARAGKRATAVVLLGAQARAEWAVHGFASGALGFVGKAQPLDALVEAIGEVAQGRRYVWPQIAPQVARASSRAEGGTVLERLSEREIELLRCIARGLRLRECAEAMGISESTAATYRQRLGHKLALHSTAELVRFAIDHGLA